MKTYGIRSPTGFIVVYNIQCSNESPFIIIFDHKLKFRPQTSMIVRQLIVSYLHIYTIVRRLQRIKYAYPCIVIPCKPNVQNKLIACITSDAKFEACEKLVEIH